MSGLAEELLGMFREDTGCGPEPAGGAAAGTGTNCPDSQGAGKTPFLFKKSNQICLQMTTLLCASDNLEPGFVYLSWSPARPQP